MGHHLSTNLCANVSNVGTLGPYCKWRFHIISLRNGISEVRYLRAVRFSSSCRGDLKAGPPIGIIQDAQLTSLGVRLGHSFHKLSRHIHFYFKRKDVPLGPMAEYTSCPVRAPKYPGRQQKRSQSHRAARERALLEEGDTIQEIKCEDKEETSETKHQKDASRHTYSGLQLFHISSLATRFGESYNYVSNHINSVFSRSDATDPDRQRASGDVPSYRGSTRRRRRRKMQTADFQNSTEAAKPREEIDADPAQCSVKDNTSSTRAEGYLLFARHINRYFGASQYPPQEDKIAREDSSTSQKEPARQIASATQRTSLELHQEKQLDCSKGLFHTSNNTTHFGESYFQMAHHVNRYFKGKSAEDNKDDPGSLSEIKSQDNTSQTQKAVSFVDCLRHPTSAIPILLGGYLKAASLVQSSSTAAPPQAPNIQVALSRMEAEERTYTWIGHLGQSLAPDDLRTCIEALNEHLVRYPSCKAVMWQEKTAVKMLKQRRSHRDNQELQRAIRETLALIGYVDPVKGIGIRVLSIDGGGTRGVVPLQVLKLLEAETGKPIHQLFDYICGVSTGAVLAFMIGLARFSLEECEDMYHRFGSDVFRQNPLVGTVKMGWSHSYYNTETWEKILREKMGEKILIRTSRDELSPKVSAVSAVVNWGKSPKPFVFRNYNHTPGSLSRYAGSSLYQMWQAVRASSAAPGYFQEFPLQSDIHQDGGIILNNPCALAVHESRLLWPKQPFQCVLSLGTGRYDNIKRGPVTSTSLRAKFSNLISSATDTEGVHTLLDELLAADVYFRFNPMLRAEVSLDESRPGPLDQLRKDTHVYLERNRLKVARLCLVLGAERSAASRTKDWVCERAWEMKQRWV